MVNRRELLDALVIPVGIFCGIVMEYLVFQLELTFMILGFQANTGFYLMLALFIVSPFLVTGGIVYYIKKDVMKALMASAAVIPVFLYIFVR
jgi:hypothetical protein